MPRVRKGAAVLLGACALLGAALVRPHPIVGLLARRFPDVLFFAEIEEPLVALTFDDSPHATLTPRILDALAEHGARATFFVIGAHVPGNEGILRRIVAEGHELGNHLLTDAPSARLPPDEFANQLRQTHDLLTPYGEIRWFRPGHGRFHRPMLDHVRAHGYRCALASAFAFEFHVPFAGYAARHLLLHARPGAVIVLHDGAADRERTVETLRRLLPKLTRRGYLVVTLSELVAVGDGWAG